ncbi:MAG: hypothetical protein K2M31_08550 [Muribaculaceae bacterium]|nr:hypothetical protein [Muribaculaceae bacterium]
MPVHEENIKTPQGGEVTAKKRSRHARIAKWAGIVVAVVLGLPLLLLCGLSIWLTPDRLTRLVNEEGSRYLNADIEAKDVDYTLWSSFPRFRLTTGEVRIISRSLDSVPAEIRRQLPDSAEFLGAIRSFSGEINVIDLFMNRYVIHDVSVDSLRVNLVAYNDSINNFNILPTSSGSFKKVPYISAERIQLKNPGSMKYSSVSTETRAKLDLHELDLTRKRGSGVKENTYRLQLNGTITASSAGLDILQKFPFMLGGDLSLRFNPFGISLSDYSIDLGELKSRLSMSVGIGDDPKVESFDYKISNLSLTGLLGYIPKEFVPSLQGLQADVPIDISARLLSSWKISSETLPFIAIDFSIPEGTLSYTLALPSGNQKSSRYATYTLDHSPIKASFVFDGKEPEKSFISVKDFRISAEGVKVIAGLMITRLTSHPLIAANVDVDADVARSLRLLPFTPPVKASGNINLRSKISFSLSDFSKAGLQNGLTGLSVVADLRAGNMHVDAPDLGLKGSIDNLNIMVQETSELFNSTGMLNPEASLSGSIASADLSLPGSSRLTVGRISFDTQSGYNGMLTPDILKQGLPVSIESELGNVAYNDPLSSTSVKSGKILIADRLSKRSGNPALDLLSDGITISSPQIDLSSGTNHLIFHDFQFSGKVAMRPEGKQTATISQANDSAGNLIAGSERSQSVFDTVGNKSEPRIQSATAVDLKSTPKLIDFKTPQALRQIFDQYALNASVKASRIDLRTPGFHKGNYFSNLDLTIGENNIHLSNLGIMLENTRARLSADLGNIRSFLLNPASENNPLVTTLSLSLDTVNINALARAYVESKGGMNNIPRHDTVTASDSVALLIPRNLKTDIRLSAKELLYTNLDLTDVKADIALRRGVLDIPDLSLASSFGRAALNVTYDSSDLDALRLALGLDIDNIDIVRFFKKFPSLIRMMPEMKNLSGDISAGVTFSTDIFPDMYINMPSTRAELDVQGRGLTVKQSKFIRRITRMMLIESGGPIHIHDMDVHAEIHDNLLQLDPFYFEFDRYRIRMLGVNNFYGDLYYHIAVDKSPVPFPFSVNIEGQFHHPKLRFGGAHYNVKRAEEVTSQIQEENNINMVLILRKLLRAFVGEAAKRKWN